MPATPESFAEAYAAVSAQNRRTLERLAGLLRRFEDEGVDCILLKGADLVTRVYGGLGFRGVGDVDLLAREADLPKIDAVARQLGLRPKIDGNAAYMDAEGSFVIDVMTRVWYLESDDDYWRRSITRDALGARVRSLDATDALLFSCTWVCLHRAWLSAKFAEDVALVVQNEAIDWARLAADARRLGLRAPLYHALGYAAGKRALALPLEPLAPENAGERLGMRLLRRLVTERRLPGMSHLLVLLTRPRGSKLAALRNSFFPDKVFLSYRYGERAGRAERLARPFYLIGRTLALGGRIAARLALSWP